MREFSKRVKDFYERNKKNIKTSSEVEWSIVVPEKIKRWDDREIYDLAGLFRADFLLVKYNHKVQGLRYDKHIKVGDIFNRSGNNGSFGEGTYLLNFQEYNVRQHNYHKLIGNLFLCETQGFHYKCITPHKANEIFVPKNISVKVLEKVKDKKRLSELLNSQR